MIKTFLLFSVVMLMSFTKCFSQVNSKPIVIDNTLQVEIPYAFTPAEDLMKAKSTMNDKLVYMAVITPEKGDKPSPLSISKYINDSQTPIDVAFSASAKHKVDAPGYEIVDYGARQVNGKTLRYKISKFSYEGQEVASIMYYFMKNDASNVLYELKLPCNFKNLDKYQKVLENIALTVSFVN